MAEKKRLTGRNGHVYRAVKSEIIQGNGETVLSKGIFYVPLTIAESESGFPEGVQVGRVFVGDGTSKPEEDDTYISLTLTSMCDVTSFSVEFSKDEIDITTLCDDMMKYASGFADATGTLEGITTLNLTESVIAKFVSVQKQDAQGKITTIEQNDDILILALEVNEIDNTKADRAIFFTPATLNGYTIGASINEAQTYSSDFRIAQDADIKTVFLEADKALFV